MGCSPARVAVVATVRLSGLLVAARTCLGNRRDGDVLALGVQDHRRDPTRPVDYERVFVLGLSGEESPFASASRNRMGIRFPRFSSLSDAIRRAEKLTESLSRCCLLTQAMLNQPRHVVYHSHYSGIFNSHRTHHAERPYCFTRSSPIRRCNQGTVLH